MLAEQEFQIVEGFRPFRFRSLSLSSREGLYDLYECEQKQIAVVTTINLHLLSRIRALETKGLISKIVGYLRRGPTYYIFSEVDQQEYSLKSYVERIRGNAKVQPYLTLSELDRLVKFLIEVVYVLQGDSVPYCTVLTPDMILVEENEAILRFKLGFPLLQLIMSDRQLYRLIRNHYLMNTEFAAPEIIKYCLDDAEGVAYKRTGKEVLYSMGLIMLYSVFGDVFSKDDRIKALSDKRDLESQIKFRRRSMKILFSEKTLSKMAKILLERSSFMRDDIRSLKIKLASKQFKLNEPPPEAPMVIPPPPEEHVSTQEEIEGSIHSQNSESGNSKLKPSQVELNISKNASSEIMKHSKNTELSSTVYPKIHSPMEIEKPQKSEEGFEFRVANSIEDVDEQFNPLQQAIHEQTMHEKLIPDQPMFIPPKTLKAERQVAMPIKEMPVEITLPNQQWPSQSSQMMMTNSQYRVQVEDEIRKFKYRSVMSLLLAVAVATLLGTYYYLEGDS